MLYSVVNQGLGSSLHIFTKNWRTCGFSEIVKAMALWRAIEVALSL